MEAIEKRVFQPFSLEFFQAQHVTSHVQPNFTSSTGLDLREFPVGLLLSEDWTNTWHFFDPKP